MEQSINVTAPIIRSPSQQSELRTKPSTHEPLGDTSYPNCTQKVKGEITGRMEILKSNLEGRIHIL